jgi:Domain of unknown function (DUF4129)
VSGARKLLLSGAALTALIGDYLATIALIIMPVGAVLIVWGLANRRKQQALAGRTNWRKNLIAAGVISALLIVLVVTAENRQGRGRRPALGPTQSAILGTPLGAKGPRKAVKDDTVPPHRPRWQWLPVLVLGSLLLGIVVTTGAAVAYARRNREALNEEAQLARALDEVLADSLDDLRAERDPRKAVIRAYARMEQTFAAYGVPREEHETPLEYVARVLDSLRVSSFAVRRLVQLFERAKFSPHSIESSMKDDAIEALAGLRAELEYDRPEAA